jgi:threonine dehydratase
MVAPAPQPSGGAKRWDTLDDPMESRPAASPRVGDALDRFSLTAIRRAAALQTGAVVRTPLVPHRGELEGPGELLLKLETLQPIGSFKLRGIQSAVAAMSASARAAGLLTVSAGNTAQALSWCGRRYGVAAHCLMPDTAPAAKVDAVRRLGGTPRLRPRDEVFRFLREAGWLHEPFSFVHPWIDPRVIAGHGSLGLELHEERPDLEAVYLPVGGGGLLAGVASALSALGPGIEIVAVQAAGCPALAAALEHDRPVDVECRTICDGIAVPFLTAEIFPLLRSLVDEVVLVDETEVRAAMRSLALDDKLVAEPSGAIALAAARKRRRAGRARRVEACVVTGGSVDPGLLAEVVRG